MKAECNETATNCCGLKMPASDAIASACTPEEKGGIIVKGNIHKKLTFEDKFDRKYACWVKNHPKAWHWYKVKNRKLFRRKINQEEKE